MQTRLSVRWGVSMCHWPQVSTWTVCCDGWSQRWWSRVNLKVGTQHRHPFWSSSKTSSILFIFGSHAAIPCWAEFTLILPIAHNSAVYYDVTVDRCLTQTPSQMVVLHFQNTIFIVFLPNPQHLLLNCVSLPNNWIAKVNKITQNRIAHNILQKHALPSGLCGTILCFSTGQWP